MPQSIISRTVDISELRSIAMGFVNDEMQEILLFLRNVRTVRVIEIHCDGSTTVLGSATLSNSGPPQLFDRQTTYVKHVEGSAMAHTHSVDWRILECTFPLSIAYNYLRDTFDIEFLRDYVSRFKKETKVTLAIRLDGQACSGRMFNYLPIPKETGFPFHIHSTFSLIQSRADLVTMDEKGVARNSEHRYGPVPSILA